MPTKSKCGGVGIDTCKALTNVAVKDDIKKGKSFDCVICETESLFIECSYWGTAYTIGGIYRHPNGNVYHFITDLEMVLNQIDKDKNHCHEYRYNKIIQWRCRILCYNVNALWLFTLHNHSISHNKFLNDVYWSYFR